MGVTYIQARLRRPDGRGERKVEFTLADGTPIERGVSECRFEIQGKAATSPVVLGVERDGALLGSVTLKTLGLMLNPLTREILPMRMALSPYPQVAVAKRTAEEKSQSDDEELMSITRRAMLESLIAK